MSYNVTPFPRELRAWCECEPYSNELLAASLGWLCQHCKGYVTTVEAPEQKGDR